MPSDSRPFLRVGLTGGIGAGKSIVAGMFAELGRTVFSADEIAKDLMVSSDEVRQAVVRAFGAESYHADGSLNRGFLAGRIFSQSRLRHSLEGIVHPVVIAEILSRIHYLPQERQLPYVVIEAALIYESGFDQHLDYVVVVEADEMTRIQRISARDQLSEDEIRNRMRAQLPGRVISGRGDFVIKNNGSLNDLRNAVAFFDRILCQMSSEHSLPKN
jgi:dephospho-CoA kinase